MPNSQIHTTHRIHNRPQINVHTHKYTPCKQMHTSLTNTHLVNKYTHTHMCTTTHTCLGLTLRTLTAVHLCGVSLSGCRCLKLPESELLSNIHRILWRMWCGSGVMQGHPLFLEQARPCVLSGSSEALWPPQMSSPYSGLWTRSSNRWLWIDMLYAEYDMYWVPGRFWVQTLMSLQLLVWARCPNLLTYLLLNDVLNSLWVACWFNDLIQIEVVYSVICMHVCACVLFVCKSSPQLSKCSVNDNGGYWRVGCVWMCPLICSSSHMLPRLYGLSFIYVFLESGTAIGR